MLLNKKYQKMENDEICCTHRTLVSYTEKIEKYYPVKILKFCSLLKDPWIQKIEFTGQIV